MLHRSLVRHFLKEAGCFLAVEAPNRLIWTNLLGPGFIPQAIPPPGFGFVCEMGPETFLGPGYWRRMVDRVQTSLPN